MFGFFIGAACLIGLVAMTRRGRHHSFSHGDWHGRRGFDGRFFFHRVLDRLDTTPGQEKVLRSVMHELAEQASEWRSEVTGTRMDVAAAFRAPELDKVLLDSVFVKHDELIERMRASAVRAAEQVHSALDERQRKQLADLIESKPCHLAAC